MPPVYRHIIYIWFPYLAASRIQREIGMALPLVVIKNIKGVDIVAAGCAKAAAYGLVAGMRLADARALRPALVSRDSADVRSVPFFTVFCCLRTK